MTDFKHWVQHASWMETHMVRGMRRKYEAGQREHGGKLWRKPMLDHMFAELIDLVNYYLTHRAQIQRTAELLDLAISAGPSGRGRLAYLIRARQLLIHGNEDGKEEEEKNPDTWQEETNE